MWVFRFNMPGYMPETEPLVFETQEEAKQSCIDEILMAADQSESETVAEDLTHSAELINVEPSEFGGILADGYYYCVEKI